MRRLLILITAILAGCATRPVKTDESRAATSVESKSITVIIWGEVNDPKEYTFQADTRLTDAIARAGGFNKLAARNHVFVKRKNGKEFEFNLRRLKESTAENPILHAGDLVLVPSGAPVL